MKTLLKITIPIHLLLILSFFIVDYTSYNLIGIFLLWVLIGIYGEEIGYHRYFSHRSFKTYKPIERMLAYLGLLGNQGSLLFWVALHRGIHHRYTDKENDLHSPIHGIFSSFIGWQTKVSNKTINLMSARDIYSDKFLMFLHEYYYFIFWGTIVLSSCISLNFSLGILLPAIVLSFYQANIVNVIGHIRSLGYRNFNTTDNSVNNVFVSLILWGQGWHNNHHARPNNSNFRVKWWEIDIAHILLIPLIKK